MPHAQLQHYLWTRYSTCSNSSGLASGRCQSSTCSKEATPPWSDARPEPVLARKSDTAVPCATALPIHGQMHDARDEVDKVPLPRQIDEVAPVRPMRVQLKASFSAHALHLMPHLRIRNTLLAQSEIQNAHCKRRRNRACFILPGPLSINTRCRVAP